AFLARARCPEGDLTGDCFVGFGDLEVFADQWLASPDSPADLNADEDVGTTDFALLAEDWREIGIPLLINEVMASNSSGVLDPQGEYDDWIEIHNSSDGAIDIGGMYLTDDLEDPTMWKIPDNNPSGTTIGAHGYLLVWIDNDAGDSGLHANFELDADGDEIALFARDGATLIDTISFGDQTTDISFGRYPNAKATLRFMGYPTPGGENIGAYLGVVADTKFSHDRGFYDEPISVAITCATEGAVIYYTRDGSDPYSTQRGRPGGNVYAGPITINKNTCLRAVALIRGWMVSNIDTHSYIFLDEVLRQPRNPSGWPSGWDYEMDPEIVNNPLYRDKIKEGLLSIPTMSLLVQKDDLFDSEKGIYTNWNNQGVAWERPASIELIHPDGSEGFQTNCGVRIYGGVGRRERKKSFRLLFKGMYGATKLRYPLFGDDAVDEFDTIILRANFNDGYPFGQEVSQLIRDEFCRRLELALGNPGAHGCFVHLYVGGLYWGLYNPVERPDASFAASYFGGEEKDWDAYNSGSPAGDSTSESWNAFQTAIRAGIETDAGFQRLQGNNPDGTPNPQYTDYLDVESYINYMLLNFFVGNTDWPGHNWYGAMNRLNSTGFHFFSWDAEWVIWLTVGHGLDSSLYEDMTGVSGSLCDAYSRLRSNAEFRLMFADHVHRAFFNGGPAYVDPARPQWDPAHPERNRPAALYAELADHIESAMIPETARWGDVHGGSPRTIEHWRTERDRILDTYMVQRPEIVLGQLRNRSLYPNIDAPVFRINGSYQHGGYVTTSDSFSITSSGGTIWYTLDGSDPRGSDTPQPPSVDTTLVAESAAKRVLVPAAPISDKWKGEVAFSDRDWISGTGGVGYERGSGYEGYIGIDVESRMYGDYTGCYIRIPFAVSGNPGEFDILTLRMRYDDAFIAYINGVEVERALFDGVPAWNSSADGSHEAGGFESFDISDHIDALHQGSNLLAIHGLNTSTTSSDFLISAELVAGKSIAPPGGDGGVPPGAIQYAGPIHFTESTHVKARVRSGNTWSALNEATYAVGPVVENLRVTEIMYHPQDANNPNDPNTEFIELKNTGTETINIHLANFTNGVEFTFPNAELGPDEYVLVVKDVEAFAAKYGLGYNIAGQYTGSLNNNGERVELQDAVGTTIHNFRYRDGWYNITDGDGFSLTVKDPANTDPNRWGDKATWRPSAGIGGSPGTDDTGQIPELGDVVINEVLAHSHAEASDWIELHNTTDHTINIGGWFLSDDGSNLKKYEIAEGRTIRAGGYIVFTEELHFGNWDDPGAHMPFALSENGETLYLHSGRDG
ncbi:MAG: lamin tail domain-containing protein, partial [Phycisphaerales bacterium]